MFLSSSSPPSSISSLTSFLALFARFPCNLQLNTVIICTKSSTSSCCSDFSVLSIISISQLYKLAKALGVSTEYLKNDEIDDPAYGLDRMEYVEEMRQHAGKRDSLDLEEMLKQNQSLFAGGTISEEAKDAYFQAVMKAYLDCKEAAKQTKKKKKDN